MRAHRRTFGSFIAIVVSAATVVAGCGGDDGGGTSPATAPLVPEVVCVGNDQEVHFAYANESSAAVVVESGASNRIDGSLTDDEPLVPTVFGIGRVSPAFYAFPAGTPDTLVWTLTGPDGETRTAAADAATPECTDDLTASTFDDPRSPTIELVDVQVDEVGARATARLTDVPDQSVCPPGLQPETAEIHLDDGGGGERTAGPSTERSSEFFLVGDEPPVAQILVAALVVDRCSTDGVVGRTWPGGELAALREPTTFCITAADDGTADVTVVEGLCRLPPTSGSRTRPG